MKKFIKIASFFVIFAMCFSLGGIISNALNSKEESLMNVSGEVCTEIKGMARNDVIKQANQIILSLNIKNIGSPEYVFSVDGTDSINHTKSYYKVLYNGDSYVSFTKEGKLIGADTFLYSVPKADSELRYSIFGEKSCLDMISDRMNDEGYVLVKKVPYYNNNVLYYYEKSLSPTLTNKYDHYSVVYSKDRENIVSFYHSFNPANYKEPNISMNDAKEIISNYIYESLSSDVYMKSIDLDTYNNNGEIEVGYVSILSNGDRVVLDSSSGKVVSVETLKKNTDKNHPVLKSGQVSSAKNVNSPVVKNLKITTEKSRVGSNIIKYKIKVV